ncbi:MAG TPA: hypothetical protein VM869_01070, partial [Enhygromyxa sp.]|nr:hypothetical protein [Enhygromyxa sp.]
VRLVGVSRSKARGRRERERELAELLDRGTNEHYRDPLLYDFEYADQGDDEAGDGPSKRKRGRRRRGKGKARRNGSGRPGRPPHASAGES